VFAPRSSWRALVTPKSPARAAKTTTPCAEHAPASPEPASPAFAPEPASPASHALVSPAPALPCAPPALSVPSLAHAEHAEPAVRVEQPTTISVSHWGRLLDGELFATSRYVEWAVLMKRTWGLDVLSCPRCSRKMRVLSTITDPHVVRKILEHLGVRSEPLVKAPARDPPMEQASFGFEAA
jgi:hypothetical protein